LPDVEYSPDGKGVTIYLNPDAPQGKAVNAARSLNLPVAQYGHDYFEVVFFYRTPGGENIIARTAWEIGERAGITGIHRTPAGISYNGTGAPANGSGSAVLFVGRKEDKTLLAVGRLSHVDGIANTVIRSDTKTVTFTVDALSAGVRETASSSFLTAALDTSGSYSNVSAPTTDVIPFNIAARVFPLFRLAEKTYTPGTARTVNASYTFDLASGAAFNTFGFIVADLAPYFQRVEWIEPRYTVAGNNIVTATTLVHDQNTTINLINNTTAGNAFINPVQFSFNITNTVNGSVFSLVFAIPIYALSAAENPVRWNLKPGYGTYLYELDDGRGGPGGAILIGTGDIEAYLDKRLVVKNMPTVSQSTNSAFNLQGAVIHLLSAEGHFIIPVNHPNLSIWVEGAANGPGAVPIKRPFDVELRYLDPDTERTFSDFFMVWD